MASVQAATPSASEVKDVFKKWDVKSTGAIDRSLLVALMSKLLPHLESEEVARLVDDVGAGQGNFVPYEAFVDKLLGPSAKGPKAAPKAPPELEIISNSTPIKPPKEATLLDNTLLFLPEAAVRELGLEPNMDDKGDVRKELWFGRVWELRALMATRYAKVLERLRVKEEQVADDRKEQLEAKLNPHLISNLWKVQAHWKGYVYRRRCSLSVLEKLRWCNLRGTLVYAHGSGGCSWDNFRICRMVCRMGILVVAPDDFAYPDGTAMAKLRHKDVLPLKRAEDNTDYWEGDLMYASGSEGGLTYSTKPDGVLEEPEHYRDLYQRCYELRRSELHFIIKRLPLWVQTQGFFLGGTSEGAMTIARFDDQRYGEMVCGRFINSFSVEYCYFTPTPEAGQIGGQLDVPTLNIIGTKDQYFGPTDSVAKIVASDAVSGYGSKNLTGNGYETFLKQGVETGLVCVLEDGVHSPCKTHDNFLRQLFNTFFARPGSIWQLDAIWTPDETRRELIEVKHSTVGDPSRKINVVQLFVPRMKFPQQMSLRWVEDMRRMSANDKAIKEQMEKEEGQIAAEQSQVQMMLNKVRARAKANEVAFKAISPAKESFYTNDKVLKVKPGHYLKHGL